MVVIRSVHAHACAGNAVFAESNTRNHRLLCKCPVPVVAIQFVRLRVVRKQEIRPAIVVVVEHGDSECLRGRLAEAGFLRDVLKSAVSAIVPEANGCPFVGFRRTVRFALPIESAVKIRFRRPLYIVSDDKIEMAILVVVDPCSAGAEFFWTKQACLVKKNSAPALHGSTT